MIKTLQRYGMFGTLQWVVPKAEVALSRIAFFLAQREFSVDSPPA